MRSVPNKIQQGHTLGVPKKGHTSFKKGDTPHYFSSQKGGHTLGAPKKRDTPHSKKETHLIIFLLSSKKGHTSFKKGTYLFF